MPPVDLLALGDEHPALFDALMAEVNGWSAQPPRSPLSRNDAADVTSFFAR